MTPLDLARAFLQKGDEDEVLLGKLETDTEVSESIFGFHVQQAAEKYIKAFLTWHQVEFSQARTLDEDTLARHRRVLGADHPDTRQSEQSLAEVLRKLDQGRPL